MKHQRQQDGDGKRYHQLIQAQNQRVRKQGAEQRRTEKFFKMGKPHPRAPQNAFGGNKIFKSNLQAVERRIIEHRHIEQHGKQKQIQYKISSDAQYSLH